MGSRRIAFLATLMATIALISNQGASAASFTDGFEGYPTGSAWEDGTTHGAWTAVYDGYGSTAVEPDGSNVLSVSPAAATSAGETHAALVRSTQNFGDVDFTVRVRTVDQLRSTPNPWEVGWVLWHYGDNTHFYYLALKPNGWELGKEDPAYPGAQRFLASGQSPGFAVGSWHTVRVRQSGSTLSLWADGTALGALTDGERPYLSGGIGLYSEDAHVHFDDVSVSG